MRIARFSLVSHLAVRERHVTVLDHVTYLSLHGHQEKRDKVHDEYGPEDGYVEHGKECAHDRDEQRLECRVPELELRQATHERPELLIGRSGQVRLVLVILHVVDDHGRQKEYELIEQENSENVGHNIKALQTNDSVHEVDGE